MQNQPSAVPLDVLAVFERLREDVESTTSEQTKNELGDVLRDVQKKTQLLFNSVKNLVGSGPSAAAFGRGPVNDAADDVVDAVEDVSVKVPELRLPVKIFQETVKGCVAACLDAPASGHVAAARAG
jgi:hypothetical protein